MSDQSAAPAGRRPYMPGYGLAGPTEGRGLLAWSWADERLGWSHDFWLATVRPDGRPHLMPVWGVWHDRAVWFSCSVGSRKTVNLRADPHCTLATDNAYEPVVLEGIAEVVTDPEALTATLARENTKYGTKYGPEMVDPALNTTYRVRPLWVFSLDEGDFTGTPTCWSFPPDGD
jgi:PPOX class probable F420-dependent enzyme